MKRIIIAIWSVFLLMGCGIGIEDPTDSRKFFDESFDEPDYNTPRQISVEDIEAQGDISNLTVQEGISGDGNYYSNIDFTLKAINSGTTISFDNFSPLHLAGTGDGGYAIELRLVPVIPEGTYLDMVFIPPEGDELFQEEIFSEILCNVATNECFAGAFIGFTEEEVATLKQRFRDEDFYGFKIKFIVRTKQIVTEERVNDAGLNPDSWGSIFINDDPGLQRYSNLLTGTTDILTVLEEIGVPDEVITKIRALFIVSIYDLNNEVNGNEIRLTF